VALLHPQQGYDSPDSDEGDDEGVGAHSKSPQTGSGVSSAQKEPQAQQ